MCCFVQRSRAIRQRPAAWSVTDSALTPEVMPSNDAGYASITHELSVRQSPGADPTVVDRDIPAGAGQHIITVAVLIAAIAAMCWIGRRLHGSVAGRRYEIGLSVSVWVIWSGYRARLRHTRVGSREHAALPRSATSSP
jgi:hypothetical protein